MANQPGLVGTVHRFLATMDGPVWEEPTPALASAVATLHWTVWVNRPSSLASSWPHLAPEPAFPEVVLLDPQDEPPPHGTICTNDSLAAQGGAAALQASADRSMLLAIAATRSSTKCELVALVLVRHFLPPRLWCWPTP